MHLCNSFQARRCKDPDVVSNAFNFNEDNVTCREADQVNVVIPRSLTFLRSKEATTSLKMIKNSEILWNNEFFTI